MRCNHADQIIGERNMTREEKQQKFDERCEYVKLVRDWHTSTGSEQTRIQNRIDELDKKYPLIAFGIMS